jgi:hypothetical protein
MELVPKELVPKEWGPKEWGPKEWGPKEWGPMDQQEWVLTHYTTEFGCSNNILCQHFHFHYKKDH